MDNVELLDKVIDALKGRKVDLNILDADQKVGATYYNSGLKIAEAVVFDFKLELLDLKPKRYRVREA